LVYEDTAPDIIERGFVARALSTGFGWVLLLCVAGVLGGTAFGMFVRERPDDATSYAWAPSQPGPSRQHAPQPSQPAPSATENASSPHPEPLRVREVRHWEDGETTSAPAPLPASESRWRQTWPEPRGKGPVPPWERRPMPPSQSQQQPQRSSGSTTGRDASSPASSRDVLREWMREDHDENEA